MCVSACASVCKRKCHLDIPELLHMIYYLLKKNKKIAKIVIQVVLITLDPGEIKTKKQSMCIQLIPFNELRLAFLDHIHVPYDHRNMAQR